MTLFLDGCRGATFSHVRGGEDAGIALRSILAIRSEDAAHKMLCGMRWPDTDGAPICPHCSSAAVYTYRCRRLFKCKACHRQFSGNRSLPPSHGGCATGIGEWGRPWRAVAKRFRA